MNMRYLTALCLSTAFSVGSFTTVFAQGDSDPGFSTIGAMRTASSILVTEDDYENNAAHFSVGNTFSKGEKDVVLNIPALEVRMPVMDIGYIDVKVPFFAVNGDLGHRWGLGDISLAYTHVFQADPYTWTLQATAGVLMGMGTSNISDGNTRPLPMAYQPSLGSTDAIVGVSAQWKEYLSFAAGYQQPIIRYNQNDYFRSSYINDPIYSNSNYEISRMLYRNGDVLARIEGHYVGNRAGVSAGPLAFYHLRNDLYLDRTGAWREVNGSQGFTLNVVANAFVRFGRYGSCKLDLTGGFPVIQRDAKPDGLTREWILTPRFTYFFNQRALLF